MRLTMRPCPRLHLRLLALSVMALCILPLCALAQTTPAGATASGTVAVPTSSAGAAAPAATTSTSVCSRYAQRIFNADTPDTQYNFIRTLINTMFVGNYSSFARGNGASNGILVESGYVQPGNTSSPTVNLRQYFNGSLLSTNRGGVASSVNFLDGGGADVLRQGIAANDSSSQQYVMMQHFYSYFGILLGCSSVGASSGSSLRAYSGSTSMGRTHKFMDLSNDEWLFFVNELGYAAFALGFSSADNDYLSRLLNNFRYKCDQPKSFPFSNDASSQAICTGPGCTAAPVNPDCSVPDSNGTSGVPPQRVQTALDGSNGGGGSNAGAIAGGVVGGILGAGLLLFCILFAIKWRQHKRAELAQWQQEHMLPNMQEQQQQRGQQHGPDGQSDARSLNFSGRGVPAPAGILRPAPAAGAAAPGVGFNQQQQQPVAHPAVSRVAQQQQQDPHARPRPSVGSPGSASFSSDLPYTQQQ